MSDSDSDDESVFWIDSDSEGSDFDDAVVFDGVNRAHAETDVAMPERWRFLLKWFKLLKRRVSASDPCRYDTHDVRLGRDPDDWRLEVSLEDMSEDGEARGVEIKRYRSVREALILTTILAEVDYDTWLRELKRTSLFRPRRFMDLKLYPLQRKYLVTFYSNFLPELYSWELLQDVFGDNHYSAEFTRDFSAVVALAAEHGADVNKMAPISVAFQLRCGRFSAVHELEILRNFRDTAVHIREIESNYRHHLQHDATFAAPPVFCLDSVEINVRAFRMDVQMLNELQRLVESGVHIESMTLPSSGLNDSHDDQDEEEMEFSAWVALVRSMTGHGTQPASVRRLTVPGWFCREPFLAAFCSALPTARGLQFVRLECTIDDDDACAPSARTWAWLGYGLFHPASQSSVETLNLRGFQLNDQAVDSFEDSMDTNWDSLAYVWQLTPQPLGPSKEIPVRRQVTIMQGSTLELSDSVYSDLRITAMEPLTGFVMSGEDSTGGRLLDVLIPGLGFCRVDPSQLQNKRQRREDLHDPVVQAQATPQRPRRGITSLLLDFCNDDDGGEERTEAGTNLSRLVGLIGSSLTSLAIVVAEMDDEDLAFCLESCPRLKNLRLGSMALTSMAPLVDFYEKGGQLTSLELRDFSVPIAAFDAFIRRLADEQTSRFGLQRLRIGQGWSHQFRETTAYALQHLLNTSKRFEYLHLFKTDEWVMGDSTYSDWHFSRFRRGALHIPVDLPRRLAFLSVLRGDEGKEQSKPGSQLTEDVVRHVFDLAAVLLPRTVIEEQDSILRVDRYE